MVALTDPFAIVVVAPYFGVIIMGLDGVAEKIAAIQPP
jgi:hypothetical protein